MITNIEAIQKRDGKLIGMKNQRIKGKERELFRAFTIKCHENALQFLQDAELLFQNRSYGHCYALLILGFEEWAKSLLGFALHIDFLKKTDHELHSLLKDHTWKQSIGLSWFYTLLINALAEESELKDSYIQLTQEFWEGKISEKRYDEQFRILIQQDPSRIGQLVSSFIDVLDEWNTNPWFLEERKQKGLYVEFQLKNFSTTSPQDGFTRIAVEENLKTYELIIASTNDLIEALKDRKKQNKYIKQLYQFGEQFRRVIDEWGSP